MSKPINLSQLDVLELTQFGCTCVVRALNHHTDPEQPPETAHQVGDQLWGREVVSARKKEDTKWYYLADGKEPNRFWLKNYQMPGAACRFELEVRAESVEYIGGHWVASTTIAVVREKLWQLDFDQVREYGMRTRHVPTFPSRVLDLATDASLRRCALVQQHERFHHNEWFLPLRDAYVRTFLKSVRFTQQPVVIVNGMEMNAGKEVPT